MDGPFSIGETARRVGRSANTLRIWERQGLIPKPLRDSTQRRLYTEEHIQAIQRVIDKRPKKDAA